LSVGTTSSIKVLLVDDEPTTMELTKLNLEEADKSFKITLAPTPKEALTLLEEKPFDCVVSDYQMPEMNGIQLCTKIRKKSNIPFIIYTGRGSEEVASEAFTSGVDDYVRKEETLAHYKVLEKRIRQAVEKRRIENLYRKITDDNRDGFAIIQGLNFVFANRAMANMLGINRP
jgi:CheY-like chemotaxis protein